MRKTVLYLIVISGLLLAVSGIVAVVKLAQPGNATAKSETVSNSDSVSVLTVLKAHGEYHDRIRSRFTQTATLTYYSNSSTGSKRLLDLKLKLSIDGSLVRYEKATPNRRHSYLFDGQTVVQTISGDRIQQEVRVLDRSEAAGIKFQIATFGLLPTLQRFADPGSQVIYLGATSRGNKFQGTTVKGPWHFYTDSDHLIERVEDGNMSITYGDYRTVEGLKLPFYQQGRKADQLLYEIKFDTPDLNPVFTADFFKSGIL